MLIRMFHCVLTVPSGAVRVGGGVDNCLSVISICNAAPTATDVSITGTVANGQTLTGSYDYSDDEGDKEGTSTFQWYSSTKADCSDKTAISGATSKTYTIQTSDVGKFICFGVTPVATSGTSPGTEVIKTTSTKVPENAAPTATGVSISGTAANGQT